VAKLPDCCVAHVAAYVGVDPEWYPQENAALCCSQCLARLVYHEGAWRRTAQEDIVMRPEPKAEAVLAHATLKPQPILGGLLAGLEGGNE